MTIDDLFALDPNAFVAARDQLARELRGDGDKEAARAVKALRRPSVPVWALNQVARTQAGAIGAALETNEAARRAQTDVVNGAEPSVLRAALGERRAAFDAVLAHAAATIDDSGRSSTSYERELADTLNAVVANATSAEQLRVGRLATVPAGEEADADLFAGLPEPTQPFARRREKSDEDAAEVKRELDAAKQRVRDADKAYRDAVVERDRAARALEHAQQAVDRTERELADAQELVRRLGG